MQISDEKIKEIENEYLAGTPLREIKEITGISVATVMKVVKRANIPLRQKQPKIQRDESHPANQFYTSDYKKRYDLSYQDYLSLYDMQKGVCAICKKTNGTSKLFVDHCHATGEVRGLLCRGCNMGIGGLKDSPELLYAAIEYLN
jgi:hypothetical protein